MRRQANGQSGMVCNSWVPSFVCIAVWNFFAPDNGNRAFVTVQVQTKTISTCVSCIVVFNSNLCACLALIHFSRWLRIVSLYSFNECGGPCSCEIFCSALHFLCCRYLKSYRNNELNWTESRQEKRVKVSIFFLSSLLFSQYITARRS